MPEETNDLLPMVRTAALCERVLHEQDGVISLIRLVDNFILTAEAQSSEVTPPEQMPSHEISITLVLSMIADRARGPRTITLSVVKPDQSRAEAATFNPKFDNSLTTHNWIVRLKLNVTEEGIHWVEWMCDGQPLTRTPLRIGYVRKSKIDDSVQ
jgi:hypothetical protein